MTCVINCLTVFGILSSGLIKRNDNSMQAYTEDCMQKTARSHLMCCILPVLPICSVKSKLWFKLRIYIWNRANHNLFKLQCATYILLLKSSIPTALLISECLKSQFSALCLVNNLVSITEKWKSKHERDLGHSPGVLPCSY